MDVRKAASPAPGFSARMATLNQIMLKFRPIAPKPPTEESVSDSMSASGDSHTPPLTLTKRNRPKRKYVRVNSKRNNSSNNKNSSTGSGNDRKGRTGKEEEDDEKRDLQSDGAVVSSDLTRPTVSRDIGSSINMTAFVLPTNWGKFGNNDNFGPGLEDRSDRGVGVESWVVVNGMTTETLLDVGELGSTDREKIRNLEMDTCPGLVSDGLYRVQWMNLAYRKMVESVGSEEPPGKVAVWLVLEENVPEGWRVFACTVKVVYTWRKEKHSKTMPCDVWKMDFGGFAWRLDAKAELCLGR